MLPFRAARNMDMFATTLSDVPFDTPEIPRDEDYGKSNGYYCVIA